MPPTPCPDQGSVQLVFGPDSNENEVDMAARQSPAPNTCHHVGKLSASAEMSTNASIPMKLLIEDPSTNDATITREPLFVSQANVLFCTPPSDAQASQARFTPAAFASGSQV